MKPFAGTVGVVVGSRGSPEEAVLCDTANHVRTVLVALHTEALDMDRNELRRDEGM